MRLRRAICFRTALGDEPLPFLGDNGKMYRVIQNLVENILKYSLCGTRVYIDAGKENREDFRDDEKHFRL